MVKIINFIDVVSNSLIGLIDNVEFDNEIYISLTNEEKRFLEFYISSLINDECEFGKKNLVLYSCSPELNWRRHEEENEVIFPPRLLVSDESVHVTTTFEKFIQRIWNNLSKKCINSNVCYISDPTIDFIDILSIIREYFPYDISYFRHEYHILKDVNSQYVRRLDIPAYLKSTIGNILRSKSLII